MKIVGISKRHADTPEHHQRLARVADGPSSFDQIAGHAAAKKIAKIGGKKRDPHGEQPSSQEMPLATR